MQHADGAETCFIDMPEAGQRNPLHILWRTGARYALVPASFEPSTGTTRPCSGQRPYKVSPENAGKPAVLIVECNDMLIAITSPAV